jgi:hypothetical protein
VVLPIDGAARGITVMAAVGMAVTVALSAVVRMASIAMRQTKQLKTNLRDGVPQGALLRSSINDNFITTSRTCGDAIIPSWGVGADMQMLCRTVYWYRRHGCRLPRMRNYARLKIRGQ